MPNATGLLNKAGRKIENRKLGGNICEVTDETVMVVFGVSGSNNEMENGQKGLVGITVR